MAKIKAVTAPKLKAGYSFNTPAFNVGIILLLSFATYWVMKPVIEMPPQRDAGCFLYIGQNWLKGLIPYKDMWDHKGPLLYLLNAMGILAGGRDGVVFLQVVLTSLGFFYIFRTCARFVNTIAALLISLAGLLTLFFIHQSGNQTEQWGIFFQGLALFLFFKSQGKNVLGKTTWMVLGFLMACSFLLRPNQVALWIVIALTEIIFTLMGRQGVKAMFTKAVYGLIGFLIPVTLFAAYFGYHQALDEMVDCLFTFNFIYTGAANASIMDNMMLGLRSVHYFRIISAGIVINTIIYIVKYRRVQKEQMLLFLFSTAWFIAETILSSLAGANHFHYYVQWLLPAVLAFCSFIVSLKLLVVKPQYLMYAQLSVSAVLLVFVFRGVKTEHAVQMEGVETYMYENRFREKVAEKVMNTTDESDYVLEWGLVDGMNFMTGRRSPTRYFYPYALDTKGYTSEAKVEEFLNEVKSKKPKLILDASRLERFPQIDSINRDSFYKQKPHMKGLIPANINKFYRYVEDNYVYEGDIGFMLFFRRKKGV